MLIFKHLSTFLLSDCLSVPVSHTYVSIGNIKELNNPILKIFPKLGVFSYFDRLTHGNFCHRWPWFLECTSDFWPDRGMSLQNETGWSWLCVDDCCLAYQLSWFWSSLCLIPDDIKESHFQPVLWDQSIFLYSSTIYWDFYQTFDCSLHNMFMFSLYIEWLWREYIFLFDSLFLDSMI